MFDSEVMDGGMMSLPVLNAFADGLARSESDTMGRAASTVSIGALIASLNTTVGQVQPPVLIVLLQVYLSGGRRKRTMMRPLST